MMSATEDYKRRRFLQLAVRQRIGVAGLLVGIFMLLGVLLLYLSEIFGISSGHLHLPFVPSLPPITCKTPHHNTGDSTQTISSGGLNRTFLLHLPPSYGRQAQPVIINYHGYSWSVQMMVNATRFNPLADQQGFVSVYPQGYETPSTWNAGVGAYGPTGSEDDIQFTRDMLSYLEHNYCIDSQRVYVTGFSLGGGMAYRLACDMSGQITAIATASGAYYPLAEGCHPARPMPILEIHGAADTSAPYDGNPPLLMASVQDYLNTWLTLDKCDTTPHVFLQQPDVTGSEWTHCAAGVQIRHYRIADGIHSWPSPSVLNGSVVMWDFFKQFSLKSA